MALFKISKGLKANLPSTKKAGNCWYTTDDSLFYIDYEDENGVVQRKALNAKDAETLSGASLATILNSSDIEIPTSRAVLDAIASKYAFGNIAVSGQTTVAADTATDTVTFAGSNVTITTDATNDKVTFAVADGSTSAKGVVQLTNSTSSTSTTTAATPNSVKSAYDLANTAKTNASNAQAKADSAYDLADLAINAVYVGPDMPTDPNVKVWINTAEEGTGVVPVMPRVATITLAASAWTGNSAPYSQVVSIPTVTSATKIELNATVQQILSLQNDDIALMAENSDGAVTVYSFGGKPSASMTMQVTLTEVAYV